MNGRHPFPFGGKGHLLHARHSLIEMRLPEAHPCRSDNQGALGRVSDGVVTLAFVVALKNSVVAQCRAEQEETDVAVDVQQRCVFGSHQRARVLQVRCEVELGTGHIQGHHRHAVLGQRPGLV